MGKILEYREKGKTHRDNWLKRLLWHAAGADIPLLSICPLDQAKYTALGGAITLCSIMVGCCSSYFVHSLSGSMILTAGFGILTALLFFFIYRMAISTMYSDGKSSVSPREIKSAIPSIILSIAIGIFISTTLEMAIFKGQIETELNKECAEYVASVIGEEKLIAEESLVEKQKAIEELSAQMVIEEKSNKQNVGRGLVWKSLHDRRERLVSERDSIKLANESIIEMLRQEETHKYLQNVDYAKRVEAMYNVSSWNVNTKLGLIRIFISLIFIVILLSPIISKMMFEDGAYEQLVIKMTDEIKSEFVDAVHNKSIDNNLTQD